MKERTPAQEEEPLFLDELPNRARAARPSTETLDDLFPSEDDLPAAAPTHASGVDWRDLNVLNRRAADAALDTPSPFRRPGRPTLVIASIATAVLLVFALLGLLLR